MIPVFKNVEIDYTLLSAPSVRLSKSMRGPKGDVISVFDLRFCKPNTETLDERGTHTMEHLFAGFMREHLNDEDCEIIDISPMGSRTSFRISAIGTLLPGVVRDT